MNRKRSSIGRIVVGVDGSEGSAAALRWAAGLARAVGGEVVVVHVLDPSEYDPRPLGLPRAVLNEADWRETVQQELEAVWCAPLAEEGVRHRVRVEEGRPGPGLTAVAEQEHADLVVTGRRGLSGLAELVQGSVSVYVTHHSHCPVTVVVAPARAA